MLLKWLMVNSSFQEKNPSKPAELEFEEDENPERGNWSGKLDFLLSCLGYAVGLGNVWRFPYLCFKNVGGSFLIPCFRMLAVIGIPTFLLELKIGQYSALGPVTLYSHLSPLFKGLGFVNFISQCFVGLYYNMIIAWTIYYFFASLTSELPWADCSNSYNDEGRLFWGTGSKLRSKVFSLEMILFLTLSMCSIHVCSCLV